MAFELWNRESANIIGEFSQEDEALAFVYASVEKHGPDVVLSWALAFEDDEGDTHSIAIGEDLLRRSMQPVPA
ncbi:MAG: hypothetical protein AB7R89_06240 [Dehalococcoidia bacterium]